MEKKTEWNVGYWIVAIPSFMMLQNGWSAARDRCVLKTFLVICNLDKM